MTHTSTESIQSNYARIAKKYTQHAYLYQRVAAELLNRLDLIEIEIARIVELGCGTGSAVKNLSKAFPKAKISFVDNCSEMLQLAKKQKPWFKKCTYSQQDAQSLSFANDSFDCVISNLMLQDCQNPDAIFSEVQRISRQNGLFSFTTLGPDSFKELRSAIGSTNIDFDSSSLGHLTDMHDLGDALLRSGLREPVMDTDIYTLSFSTFAQLFNELDSLGCIKQTFTANELQQIADNFPVNPLDGAYEVSFEVVYGQAWAGDGKSKSRTPEEFHFPVDQLIQRKN